jgi:hypothetical protein
MNAQHLLFPYENEWEGTGDQSDYKAYDQRHECRITSVDDRNYYRQEHEECTDKQRLSYIQ